jgi:hypothetical protein
VALKQLSTFTVAAALKVVVLIWTIPGDIPAATHAAPFQNSVLFVSCKYEY